MRRTTRPSKKLQFPPPSERRPFFPPSLHPSSFLQVDFDSHPSKSLLLSSSRGRAGYVADKATRRQHLRERERERESTHFVSPFIFISPQPLIHIATQHLSSESRRSPRTWFLSTLPEHALRETEMMPHCHWFGNRHQSLF